MSRCPSSVYNSQPLSHSQKVSIGIPLPVPNKEPPFPVKHDAANSSIKHTRPSEKEKRTSSSATANSLCGLHSAPTEPLLDHGVRNKKDADNLSRKEGNMSGTDGRSENLSSLRKQSHVSLIQDQTAAAGMEDTNKEALRMKLRQILGANTLSHDKVNDAKIPGMSTRTMLDDHNSKPRQNSDTIETDSENASLTTKRPVTKSRARNKAPAAGQTRISKPKLSCDKEGKHGNSISSCAKKSRSVNPVCSMTEWTDGSKKSYGIRPGDLKNIQPAVTGREKLSNGKEMPLQSFTRPPASHDVCLGENIELTMKDVNLNHSPVISEKQQLLHSENPVLQDKSEHHESFGFPTRALHDDGVDHPLFKMRRTVLDSPTGLFPVNNDESQRLHQSPCEVDKSILNDKCLSLSSSSTENAPNSSDATATPDDRHAFAQDLPVDDKDVDNEIFTPGRGESYSSEDVSSLKRAYTEDVQTSPEIGLVEKPTFLNKRRRNEDADFDDFSPSFTVLKAGGKFDDIFTEASERNVDEGLARAISVLGLALEKVKNKMVSATNRRCSDILMSAAEEIHSQLQDFESQIQTDLGKLKCLKVSKRKHMETRLQEQQEHLKVIHEKFKEEILEYLQDCRGAVEGLETQHIELNGAIETQKASHRKLVAQAEAAVENHIVDIQRKITSVHKMGTKKIQQLKVAVGECLKDVISG